MPNIASKRPIPLPKRTRLSRLWSLPSVTAFGAVAAAYLVACLALGGGSREGFLGDVALQVMAVPFLLWAVWRLLDLPPENGGGRAKRMLLLCLLVMAVPAAHLVPLPPSVWMSLPGREDFEGNLVAAGLQVGWLPLSLVPRATWLSALALLPPMAVFLACLQLGYPDRRRFSVVLLIAGFVSVGLGLLQVAQGPSSPLRFYAYTNTTEAVGFFANRNHYAALLYCLVLVAAAWAVAAVASFTRAGATMRSRRSTSHLVAMVASFTVLVVLVGAQAMARSRAGLGLTTIALVGAFALAFLAPPHAAGTEAARGLMARGATRLLGGAILVALLFSSQFALYRIQDRFGADPLSDARLPFARNTIEAAIAFMPFGSGMGTFVPVYQAFEKAADNVADYYTNRAHNDFLELWLEAGLVGLMVMGLFVVWVVVALWRAWRRDLEGAGHTDRLLACAAALMLVLLLAHSSVDYPLRTTAMMSVFAWAIAMVVAPVGLHVPSADGSGEERRHGARRSSARSRTGDAGHATTSAGTGSVGGTEKETPPFVPAPPREDWPVAWQPAKRPPLTGY
jgi:O-antigen ligase